MLEHLTLADPDPILSLMVRYREDARPGKIDLGVGVYRDDAGLTPILAAVREAERRYVAAQASKVYVGIVGDAEFNQRIAELTLGPAYDPGRSRAVQTPGGSGALRVLMDLVHLAHPHATLWLSEPTWPNHLMIAQAAHLATTRYPYVDETGALVFDAMLAALRKAMPGDVALIHGSCHNPTGVDLNLSQWAAVADLLAERGIIPLVDIAYQGFGAGLDEDAAGLRLLVAKVPEVLIAVSCSKNFGVYRDRVGAAVVVARDAAEAGAAGSRMGTVARALYSMPPHHGAALVATVLGDPALKAEWQAELASMRDRMRVLRSGLADALRRATNSARFDSIATGNGMFTRLGLSAAQIDRLRDERAVYAISDSRINIAGLPGERLDELAAHIAAVL
jgi:aspartate/tyrosine/aromatic aminotransferase